MSRVANIIWSAVGISLAVGLLVTAVVWGYRMKPNNTPCVAIQYTIQDQSERMYLTENELNQLLQSEDIYPVGRALDPAILSRIEHAVRQHPMVRTAECYATPRYEVRVKLSQRVPLLRVQTPGNSYFIDTDRRVMQARTSVKDSVLLLTGTVGVQMASTQLADFAEWLQKDDYWSARIHHLHMQSPQMAVITVNGQRVLMGPVRGYEQKLSKLRTFYENGKEALQDKSYNELDIRFKGQVIGRN